jgi:uncharacterized protein
LARADSGGYSDDLEVERCFWRPSGKLAEEIEVADQEVRFKSQGNIMAGTLVTPDAGPPVAALLMLHGSGPLDRNENTKGQRLDIFNVFADALCQSRIASFRYDKRGCGASEGSFKTAGFHDLIEDASAALDTLLSRTDASRVFLLAHSEGTLAAPVLAARRGEVAGLVLLCPTVAPMEATLLTQAAQLTKDIEQMSGWSGAATRAYFALTGTPLRTQRRLIERLRASTQDTLRWGLSRIPAKWLRELLAHDAEAWIAGVRAPILCICGEKDIQCDPQDGHRIAAIAKGSVDVHIIPDLTHILRRDDHPPSFLRYRAILGKPVDPRVVDLARAWVLSR